MLHLLLVIFFSLVFAFFQSKIVFYQIFRDLQRSLYCSNPLTHQPCYFTVTNPVTIDVWVFFTPCGQVASPITCMDTLLRTLSLRHGKPWAPCLTVSSPVMILTSLWHEQAISQQIPPGNPVFVWRDGNHSISMTTQTDPPPRESKATARLVEVCWCVCTHLLWPAQFVLCFLPQDLIQ